MVYAGQSGKLREKLLEEPLRKVLDGRGDGGLVRQDYFPRDFVVRVDGEKSPVDVCAVADVGVVAFRCGVLENSLQKLLCLVAFGGGLRCLEEEFDDRSDDLKLDLQSTINSCKTIVKTANIPGWIHPGNSLRKTPKSRLRR